MKALYLYLYLFLFLLFSVGNIALAKCTINGMQFFPRQKNISLNPMFIIEGYDRSQSTIESFKKRTVYLESNTGETIALELCEILSGQMRVTQAVFKPTARLEPNTTYFLKYSNQTKRESEEMFQRHPETGEREKVYWQTSVSQSSPSLNTDLNISYEKSEVIAYGCGPSTHAIFKVSPKDNEKIWYRTEVKELSSGKKTTFYIREWKGRLHVGHGMCGGPFTFKRSGKYHVRFTLVNTDGQRRKTTDWKTFESPYVNHKSFSGF